MTRIKEHNKKLVVFVIRSIRGPFYNPLNLCNQWLKIVN